MQQQVDALARPQDLVAVMHSIGHPQRLIQVECAEHNQRRTLRMAGSSHLR